MSAAATMTPEFYSEDGLALPIARIAPAVEWIRWCGECNAETSFVADRMCPNGLIGSCFVCGAERVTPFTRTTSEVE